MMMTQTILSIVMLLTLIIGSYYDIKSRQIPVYLGLTSVLLGMISLINGKQYLAVVFFIAGIFEPSFGILSIIVPCLGVLVYANYGAESISFIIAIITALFFFKKGLLGGGDVQLLFGMIALCYGEVSLYYSVLICTAVTCILYSIRKFGIRNIPQRIKTVGSSLIFNGKYEDDTEKLRTPYIVTLLLSWVVYLVYVFAFVC